MKNIRLFTSLILVFFCNFHRVEANNVENDLTGWGGAAIRLPLTDKFESIYSIQSRFVDSISELGQLFFSGQIGYRLNNNTTAYLGYVWLPNFVQEFSQENRLLQTLTYRHRLSKFSLLQRVQLEERFLASGQGESSRIRYLLRTLYPIKNTWSAVVSNEIFINLNSLDNIKAGFKEDRLFVGLNKAFNQCLSLDFGYQLQYLHLDSNDTDLFSHGILATLFVNLPGYRQQAGMVGI